MEETEQTGTTTVLAEMKAEEAGELPKKRSLPHPPSQCLVPLGPPRVFQEDDPKYRSCGVHVRSFTITMALVQIVLVVLVVMWLGNHYCHYKRHWNRRHQDKYNHDHKHLSHYGGWNHHKEPFRRDHIFDHYYYRNNKKSFKATVSMALLYLVPLCLLLHGARVRKWGYLIPYLVCHGMVLMGMAYVMVVSIGRWTNLTGMLFGYGILALFVYTFARIVRCILYSQDYQDNQEMAARDQAMVFVPPPNGDIPRPPSADGPPAYSKEPLVVVDLTDGDRVV